MTDIKIDEFIVKATAHAMDTFIDRLKREKKIMTDLKGDLFHRYMAFSRACALIEMSTAIMDSHKNSFRLGFDLNSSLLEKSKRNESGWDNPNLEGNPFFTSKQEEGQRANYFSGMVDAVNGVVNESDLSKADREKLAGMFYKVLKGSDNEH